MDASELSVEQLEAILAERTKPTLVDAPRVVEVRGHTFTVSPDIDKSWECVDFALALGEVQGAANDDGSAAIGIVMKAFALIELATGYDRKALYGLYAPVGMGEFFQIAGELAGKCLPKN